MMTQGELATLLTSRSARELFAATSEETLSPAWADQLAVAAGIVAFKRREALSRWFPSTIAACDAVPVLRRRLEQFCDEPIPMHGPARRLRCAEALGAVLPAAATAPTLRSALAGVLRLEAHIQQLTFEPPDRVPETEGRGAAVGAALEPTTSVCLTAGVRVLRFSVDVLPLWERPAEVAPVLAAGSVPRGLPVSLALVRQSALQPVRVLRIGPGAADLLEVCRRAETVGALLDAFPSSRRDSVLTAVEVALANGLLVVT